MKKPIVLLLLSFLLWGCSDHLDLSDEVSDSSNSIYRSYDEMVYEATNIWSTLNSRSREDKTPTVKSVTPVNLHKGRSESKLIYAIEFEDEDGFILVASPKNVTPIIGIIEKGHYSPEEIANVPNFEYALECAENYVQTEAIIAPDKVDDFLPITPTYKYDTLSYKAHGTPISVTWNQSWPENKYCPNKIAGCAPVAAAQVLSYLAVNKNFSLSFPNTPKTSIFLDWNQINKHKKSLTATDPSSGSITTHLISCGASEDAHDNIGLLIRELGHRMNAKYNTSSTGVRTDNLYTVFRNEAGCSNPVRYDAENLYDALYSSKGVALITGRDVNEEEGHAWVADTYMYIANDISYYELGKLVWQKTEIDKKFVHHNWGWNGSYNGYFEAGVFNNEAPREPLITLSRYDFSKSVSYMIVTK